MSLKRYSYGLLIITCVVISVISFFKSLGTEDLTREEQIGCIVDTFIEGLDDNDIDKAVSVCSVGGSALRKIKTTKFPPTSYKEVLKIFSYPNEFTAKVELLDRCDRSQRKGVFYLLLIDGKWKLSCFE